LRKLEKVVTELHFVRNCAAVWDAESHKLCICLYTTKTKEEFPKLQNDIMSHLKILPAIYKPDKIIILDDYIKHCSSTQLSDERKIFDNQMNCFSF